MDCHLLGIDPSDNDGNGAIPDFDWNKCMLCQNIKEEKLLNPLKSKDEKAHKASYKSLADRLLQFHKIHRLPYNIPSHILLPEDNDRKAWSVV